MIIFGTRGVTYSAGSGDFYCPQCRSELPYRHKRVRRFFTLYFIPLIPIDLLGEYVECQQCRGTYRLDVLDMNLQAEDSQYEAEFHRVVKQVMVQMMIADGAVDQEELQTIRDIYAELTNSPLTDEDIRSEVDRVRREGQNIAASLAQCAGYLNDDGKAMVVKAAYLVAAADGVFQDEEKALLATIGESLGMSRIHFNSVIQTMRAK
ncbi:MAG: TerB family tellurite resistance protein [Planctomycetes bacterium]|nr:TerB family tellurite resistance protein [Planctomycetota bacterium]